MPWPLDVAAAAVACTAASDQDDDGDGDVGLSVWQRPTLWVLLLRFADFRLGEVGNGKCEMHNKVAYNLILGKW